MSKPLGAIDLATQACDRLEKETKTGVIAAIVANAAAFAHHQNESPVVNFGVIEVPISAAGFIAFSIFLFVTVQIFRSLSWIETMLDSLDENEKKRSSWIIRNHLWLFNPFFEGKGRFSWVSDNLGLFLLINLWWLGLYSGFALITVSSGISNIGDLIDLPLQLFNNPALLFGCCVYPVYAAVGIVTLRVIWRLVHEISTDQNSARRKLIFNNIGAVFGCFGVGAFYLAVLMLC